MAAPPGEGPKRPGAVAGLDVLTDRTESLVQRRAVRRRRVLNLIIAVAVINCLFFVLMYSMLDPRRYWIAILANLGVGAAFGVTLFARRAGPLPEALWFLGTTILGMFTFAFLLGLASGSHLILLSVSGMAMVLVPRRHEVWAWVLLLTSWAFFVLADRVLPQEPRLIPMHPDEAQMIFLATSAITVMVVFIVVRRAIHGTDKAEAALDAAFRQSEALLENVMPFSVAARLKRGETVADAYDSVTVCFADVVGFSASARDRRPEETISALNALFSAADAIALAHGCEKIKTIGDGILLAAGLPEPRKDHAEICLSCVEALRAAAKDIQLDDRNMDLRIGVHSGPVVAGILGTDRFAYDIWGDTVNRAARLQSEAQPGQILISDTTADLLPEARWTLRRVDDIVLKNIGLQTCFAVEQVCKSTVTESEPAGS